MNKAVNPRGEDTTLSENIEKLKHFNGVFLLNGSCKVDGGLMDMEPLTGKREKLPVLVITIPLPGKTVTAQLVFGENGLLNFKKGLMEMDMAASFPDNVEEKVLFSDDHEG